MFAALVPKDVATTSPMFRRSNCSAPLASELGKSDLDLQLMLFRVLLMFALRAYERVERLFDAYTSAGHCWAQCPALPLPVFL